MLKNTIFYFLMAGIGSAQSAADAGWFMQNPLPTGSTLNAVAVLDDNIKIAVGDSGTILRTTDGGATWMLQSGRTNANLRAVAFIDANTGIVVGDKGTILRTTDGGLPGALSGL